MGKVAVVGAGPAGMAATIQLVRSGHDVQVFEKERVGGALWNARRVDNYPGVLLRGNTALSTKCRSR